MMPDPLCSPDLSVLLRALPPNASDQVASLMCEMCEQDRLVMAECHLPRSLRQRELHGRHLVPDIVHDLSALGRHQTGPWHNYRELLRGMAGRHGVLDDGKRPVPSVERDIQRVYGSDVRPKPANFTDRGSDDLQRRLLYALPLGGWAAYLLSPNWRIVTAAILEVAAHRRFVLTRVLRAELET